MNQEEHPVLNHHEQAVISYAKLLKDVDDLCPDVGMGPSFNSFLKEANEKLKLENVDMEKIRKWLRR